MVATVLLVQFTALAFWDPRSGQSEHWQSAMQADKLLFAAANEWQVLRIKRRSTNGTNAAMSVEATEQKTKQNKKRFQLKISQTIANSHRKSIHRIYQGKRNSFGFAVSNKTETQT